MDEDGSSKKLRKPYTITKSRDRWSEEEHERFLDGLLLYGSHKWGREEMHVGENSSPSRFGREWKKIEDFVGTKTVIQIRSHAQKYFLKVQKNGLMAPVPPPRPKRNHAYPYPQKSSEDDMLQLQASILCTSPSSGFITPCASWDDKSMLVDCTSSNDSMSSDYVPLLPGVEGIHSQKFSWPGSSSRSWLTYEMPEQGNQPPLRPVIPNFAEVYNLIAIMIDPEVTNSFEIYMRKLKEMDPITAKTALVLVKNLIINVSSAEFKPLNQWLLTCDSSTNAAGETSDATATASQIYGMSSQGVGFLPMP